MTADELIKSIKDHVDEELKDSKAYQEMADEAKSFGWDAVAGMLSDIVQDELSHFRHLSMILERYEKE